MLETRPVPAFQDNYIWLIVNPIRHTVAIVDPGDATVVIEVLTSLRLVPVAILITHHHHDHVGGIEHLLQYYPVPVFGPDNELIPGRTSAVRHGDIIDIPDLDAQFQIIAVPGHTNGHIAYYGHNLLFIGDTVFMAGCGRLFEGTAAQMYASLQLVSNLPDITQIYCAHEYTLANLRFARAVEPDNADIAARIEQCNILRKANLPTVPATLAVEKKTNPFLRTNMTTVKSAAEQFAGHHLENGTDVFAQLRSWKDNY
jgi:hydroxyacylglutathione hydrolase